MKDRHSTATKPKLPGNGNLKSHAKLRREEAAIQGAGMLAVRVMQSRSYMEIGQMFNVGAPTVSKRIAQSDSMALMQLAKDIICERMFPKALAILEQRLEAGDYDAAKDVLYGMSVLQKSGKATIEHIASNTPTLDAIRRERAKAVDGEVLPIDPSSTA